MLRPASGHVADALGITEGENVIHLRTLRRVNGVALCLIDHYFADLTLWPTLQRFDSGSLHDFLREQTGIALRRSQTRISARRAQAKESQRLEIPNMSPLLCVRTLNHRTVKAARRILRQPDARRHELNSLWSTECTQIPRPATLDVRTAHSQPTNWQPA